MSDSLEEKILDNLRKVKDPEIGFDVVTLQLIREIHINAENDVVVIMTLTSPGCPFGDVIKMEVEFAVRAVSSVGAVSVSITFDPPWDPRQFDDEVKLALGIL